MKDAHFTEDQVHLTNTPIQDEYQLISLEQARGTQIKQMHVV